jgi:hypothetical protein
VIYILTHEYSDKSGFDVCGATTSHVQAWTWLRANYENNVYQIQENASPKPYDQGYEGWKK